VTSLPLASTFFYPLTWFIIERTAAFLWQRNTTNFRRSGEEHVLSSVCVSSMPKSPKANSSPQAAMSANKKAKTEVTIQDIAEDWLAVDYVPETRKVVQALLDAKDNAVTISSNIVLCICMHGICVGDVLQTCMHDVFIFLHEMFGVDGHFLDTMGISLTRIYIRVQVSTCVTVVVCIRIWLRICLNIF